MRPMDAGTPATSADAAIRLAVRDIDPTLAVFNVKTMDQVVTDSMWQLNLYRWLIGLFASLALVLATVGLYGVISFGAASRLREFAVRLALGSEPGQLIQLVVARGLILAICGIVAGFVAALMVSPSARAVSPALAIEPSTSLAVAVLLSLSPRSRRHFQRRPGIDPPRRATTGAHAIGSVHGSTPTFEITWFWLNSRTGSQTPQEPGGGTVNPATQ
jgi:hypothetical protein